MDTPILFLIYNRPQVTAKTFSMIRKAKPGRLFISADGPKKSDLEDSENCRLTREVTENIDWNCEVKRLYRSKNIGLRRSVYDAISWFFKNVKEGIIIEDDCLVDESFFLFCKKMLSKYRKSTNVMHIGGENFLPARMQNKNKYYFSRYPNVWGWATWRRAWNKMDYSMKLWDNFAKSKKYDLLLPNYWERKYWQIISNAVIGKLANSWAYRWQFSIWENGGKSISPGVNLVKNIGLVGSKTHINTNVKGLVVETNRIGLALKPFDKEYSEAADKYSSEHVYRISPVMIIAQWSYFLLKGLKLLRT